MDQANQQVVDQLKTFSTADLAPALVDIVKGRTAADQKAVVQKLNDETSGIVGPTPQTSDTLWKIVVAAFAIVLVGSFLTLAIGVFAKTNVAGVKPELILTTFTSVVGFLAGLFTPSPVAKKSDSTN